jgi:hypothetical protein
MVEVLASGLLGAILVFLLGLYHLHRERGSRVRGNWSTLYVEVCECGRIADAYLNVAIEAPLYRLPTKCYEICFPSLLSDSAIDEHGTGALLKFYAEVQTLNRGLDLADLARQTGDDERIKREFRRNSLKARRIAAPVGEYYAEAKRICERGKSEPG